MTVFFYDSYAIIEYLKNNPRFVPYFEEHTGILTIFNLVEVYYSVLAEEGKEKAEEVYNRLSPLLAEPTKEIVFKAMEYRLLHKKKKLSYADCMGYASAEIYNVLFLTGDKQFEGMEKVEFVK